MRLTDLPEDVNRVSGEVLDSAIRVHTTLGVGLLESAYKACLTHELRSRGLSVEREVPIHMKYFELEVRNAYAADLVVGEAVIVEAKTVGSLLPVHEAQLMTYLRLLGKPLGILLNFHAERIAHDGFRRLVCSHPSAPAPRDSAPPR